MNEMEVKILFSGLILIALGYVCLQLLLEKNITITEYKYGIETKNFEHLLCKEKVETGFKDCILYKENKSVPKKVNYVDSEVIGYYEEYNGEIFSEFEGYNSFDEKLGIINIIACIISLGIIWIPLKDKKRRW